MVYWIFSIIYWFLRILNMCFCIFSDNYFNFSFIILKSLKWFFQNPSCKIREKFSYKCLFFLTIMISLIDLEITLYFNINRNNICSVIF